MQSPGTQTRRTLEDDLRENRFRTSGIQATGACNKTQRIPMERVNVETVPQKNILNAQISVLIDPLHDQLNKNHCIMLYNTIQVFKQIHYDSGNRDFGDFFGPECPVKLLGKINFDEREAVLVSAIINLVDETLSSIEETSINTVVSCLTHFLRDMDAEYGFRKLQKMDIYQKSRIVAAKKMIKLVKGNANLLDNNDDDSLAKILTPLFEKRNVKMMEEQLKLQFFRQYRHLNTIEPLPKTATILKRAFPLRYSGPAIPFLELLCESSQKLFNMTLDIFCQEVRFEQKK
ncbi:hypothetical protein SS50377_26720 [Spironucleus salmonicida]|uniref:Uncharacterized protein n=1 Tax=Spironucleus salmonicida TaxID=348837 RepID=V6LZM5_9EUKA|nr:hypothetical protein SS50377_26720 [Spironucleus salmonicida]|eukprot:EST49191.1 Hypothetical protein SS50377_10407 [Spironucleus salmonicida]